MDKNPTPAANRIDTLTSTRAFAALLVVIFHFGISAYPFNYLQSFFANGNIAVGYFFVLSGFVMGLTYFTKPVDYGTYIKKRFARIAPVYYLALALTILAFLCFHFFWQGPPLGDSFGTQFVLSVFFLQAYVPGYSLSLNFPAWSLSVEFFFYLLFPALLWMMRKNGKAFFLGGVALFLVSQAATFLLLHRPDMDNHPLLFDFSYYHPLLHINEFVTGMIGSWFYIRSGDARFFKSKLLVPGVLILIIAMIILHPVPTDYHNGFLAPLFLLLILSVAWSNPALLRWQPLIFLGEVSYGIYILQRPVWYYMANELNPRFLHLQTTPLFFSYTVVLILVSSLSYYFVEKPCRNWINNFSFGRRTTSLAR
jgi:peptidoglycan/LPS O-acetylase OafA/YrhL